VDSIPNGTESSNMVINKEDSESLYLLCRIARY